MIKFLMFRAILSVLVLSILFGAYCICVIYYFPSAKKDFVIKVENGDGAIKVCNQIKKSTSFKHEAFICYYIRLASAFRRINILPGDYLVKKGATVISVVHTLSNILMHKVSFPEGMSVYEIAEVLNKDTLTNGYVDYSVLREGYLMPDTYIVGNNTSKIDVIRIMQKEMLEFIEREWEKRDPGIPLKSYHEALVLASIVEHEATVEEERDIIASVYLNRLRINMRLQADPTVVYFLTNKMGRSFFKRNIPGSGGVKRIVVHKDLFIQNEYNTYRKNGLPPTPICSPGRSSILAVLHPRQTNYLFFVSSGNGKHIFSEKFNDHVVSKNIIGKTK